MTEQPMAPSGDDLPGGGQSPSDTPPLTPPAPPAPPAPPQPPAVQSAGAKWFESVAIVVLALICCWPLGLVLVWTNRKFTKSTKWILTAVIVGLMLIGGIVAAVSGGAPSNSTDASTGPVVTSSNGSSASSSAPTSAGKASASCKDTADSVSLDTKKQGLYPSRLGITRSDHEAEVGDCVRIGGVTTYVNSSRLLTPRFGNKEIVINVTMRARDNNKSYSPLEFKLQTPTGNQETFTGSIEDSVNELEYGTLAKGGQVKGDVVFDYQGPGTYYVIWEPSVLSNEKGFWAINVP